MNTLKAWLQAPLWLESARAALLCTIVIMLNVLFGVIALHVYYSFWLAVFLFALTPIWLVCYGLFFANRWTWLEISLGVFTALFVMAFLYINHVEDWRFRVMNGILFSGAGVFAVTIGYAIRKLSHSITSLFPTAPEAKKDRGL